MLSPDVWILEHRGGDKSLARLEICNVRSLLFRCVLLVTKRAVSILLDITIRNLTF